MNFMYIQNIGDVYLLRVYEYIFILNNTKCGVYYGFWV